MRRLLVTGLSIAWLFGAVGLTGCGGGGVEEGIPADTKPAVPLDSIKTQMVPQNKMPKAAAPAPDAKAETPK
jgi:hypothetical protein